MDVTETVYFMQCKGSGSLLHISCINVIKKFHSWLMCCLLSMEQQVDNISNPP